MEIKRTYDEINRKIARGEAVVVTAEEVIGMVDENGISRTASEVDVVTTGTFSPMCSSGVFLNFGHSDPPIRMQKIWLNDVPAHGGLAAVDTYLGATSVSSADSGYGGAHVIESLVRGEQVRLFAKSQGTDCYPRKETDRLISLDTINEAIMFNPRNCYQNYNVAVNTSDETFHTYMGTLLPSIGNATFSTSGQLSPLLNDPTFRTIGMGTSVFFCGAKGYVSWNGTQHSPHTGEFGNKSYRMGGTLSLIGDLKKMSSQYLRAAVIPGYGVSIFIGVGIPIPILDKGVMKSVSVRNSEIYAPIVDYSYSRREKPTLGIASYEELRSGTITINGRDVPTSPLSSYAKAREIAAESKLLIEKGEFFLQKPIGPLPGSSHGG